MFPELPFSQACENNRDPILAVLQRHFTSPATVLEIGTGTGQHAVYFASRLPHIRWQPADQPDWLHQSEQRFQQLAPTNVLPVRVLDVRDDTHWNGLAADHAFSANTVHFMAWTAACRMFQGIGRLLPIAGAFLLYGPFNENGSFTSDSNRMFDAHLKARDPDMGIRDKADLKTLALDNGMELVTSTPMPANNQILEFRKR